jgi:hypothetical protein
MELFSVIIYIIFFLLGFVGLIVRLARAKARQERAREAVRVLPANEIPEEREETTLQGLSVSRVEQEGGLPTAAEPQARTRVETEPEIPHAPAPATVDKPYSERAAADDRGSVRGLGWARIRNLSPLKRAIVLSELLGKPKALSEEHLPQGRVRERCDVAQPGDRGDVR